MHVYIYDNFLNHVRYSRLLARLETRITDLGLNGKICRVGLMHNINHIVQSEIYRGAKTIIAVGNDKTINQMINSMADSKIPLGIIPVGSDNEIADSLGIEREEAACDLISSRRIEKLNLGLAQNKLFLTHAKVPTQNTHVQIDAGYSIETKEDGYFYIVNFPTKEISEAIEKSFNPKDNKLDLLIHTKGKSKLFKKAIASNTVLPFSKMTVFSKHHVILDNCQTIETPCEIKLSDKTINLIVGKKRTF